MSDELYPGKVVREGQERVCGGGSGRAESSFAAPAGWVVHGERMTENGKVQHFRTPPEPHSYPEDIARQMAAEMKELHPSWVWSVAPPNEKGQP